MAKRVATYILIQNIYKFIAFMEENKGLLLFRLQ